MEKETDKVLWTSFFKKFFAGTGLFLLLMLAFFYFGHKYYDNNAMESSTPLPFGESGWLGWYLPVGGAMFIFGLSFIALFSFGLARNQRENLLAGLEAQADYQRFLRMLDKINDAMIFTDEEGRITFWNAAAEVMFGFPAEMVLSGLLGEFIVCIGDDGKKTAFFSDHCWCNDASAVSLTLLGASGAFSAEVEASSEKIGEELVQVIIVRDNSVRKKLEQLQLEQQIIEIKDQSRNELRQSEAVLEKIYNLAGAGIAQISLTGEFLMLNQTFCQIVGYSQEEMQNKTFAEITYPDDLEADLANVSLLLSGELASYKMEKRYVKKDGELIWVELMGSIVRDENNEPLFFVAVVTDITGRKQDELDRKKKSQAVEQSPVCIVTTDINGVIEYVNPVFETISGYTPQEAIGQNPRILSSGRMPSIFYVKLWETILAGRTWRGTFVNRKKDGSLYYEDASISPIYNEAGEITNFVAVKEDVTLRRKTQEALVRARIEAEKANKTKSMFVANVSHEIRTPLNAIMGYAELLAQSQEVTDAQRDKLKIITQSAEHLLSIINGILDLSKIEAGKSQLEIQNVNLLRLLGGIVDMFALQAEKKGISLKLIMQRGVPADFLSDELKLRQIMINLIANALKFTEHGRITITAESYQDTGDYLRLVVEDTGSGISKEALTRIFEYFEQADSNGHKQIGTGIGLAVSKNFTELLGGTIRVESLEKEGSRFIVELPVVLENENIHHEEVVVENNTLSGVGTILIDPALAAQLEVHVRKGAVEEINRIIKLITEQDATAGAQLDALAKDFSYEKMLTILATVKAQDKTSESS
jgi:PAS domain S-box-containing protein